MKHLFVNTLLAKAFLLGASIVAVEVAAEQPNIAGSAAKIDLSDWKLTLPVDSKGKTDGNPAEISGTQLIAGYRDDHFYAGPDGSIVFWCPVNGATTKGTEFPRSELREMLNARDPSVNWMAQGTHILAACCRVMEVPSNPKVVIGQIHGYSDKANPLIKLQYFKGRVEALVKISPTAGKDKKLTFPEVGLNNDIAYQIKLQDGVLSITVNGMTQTENVVENDAGWANQTFYFKAGVYPQDNEGDATEGTRVAFSMLKVSHGE